MNIDVSAVLDEILEFFGKQKVLNSSNLKLIADKYNLNKSEIVAVQKELDRMGIKIVNESLIYKYLEEDKASERIGEMLKGLYRKLEHERALAKTKKTPEEKAKAKARIADIELDIATIKKRKD
jgi:hypothetical protein